MTAGRLTVVGTGIGFRLQLIPAAEAAIRQADKVLYQIADTLTAEWLEQLNPGTEDLSALAPRVLTLSATVYEAMASRVFEVVAAGHNVCFVTYGHPGIYQHAAHRSIELVRAAEMPATMLPGVSALDCLVADLGIEIGAGCQIIDATSLVVQNKVLDPTSALVLFQVGIFGNPYYRADEPLPLQLLRDRLCQTWDADHEAIVYEAPMLPSEEPTVHRVRVADLETAPITERSLLYLAGEAPAPNVVATAEIASWLARLR